MVKRNALQPTTSTQPGLHEGAHTARACMRQPFPPVPACRARGPPTTGCTGRWVGTARAGPPGSHGAGLRGQGEGTRGMQGQGRHGWSTSEHTGPDKFISGPGKTCQAGQGVCQEGKQGGCRGHARALTAQLVLAADPHVVGGAQVGHVGDGALGKGREQDIQSACADQLRCEIGHGCRCCPPACLHAPTRTPLHLQPSSCHDGSSSCMADRPMALLPLPLGLLHSHTPAPGRSTKPPSLCCSPQSGWLIWAEAKHIAERPSSPGC